MIANPPFGHEMFQIETRNGAALAVVLGLLLMALGAALPLVLLTRGEAEVSAPRPYLEIDVRGDPVRSLAGEIEAS